MSWLGDRAKAVVNTVKKPDPTTIQNVLTGGMAHPNDPNSGIVGGTKTAFNNTIGRNPAINPQPGQQSRFVGDPMTGTEGKGFAHDVSIQNKSLNKGYGTGSPGAGAAPPDDFSSHRTALRDTEHTANEGVLATMAKGDKAYIDTAKASRDKYRGVADAAAQKQIGEYDRAHDERAQALSDSKTQYTSTVEPRMKAAMEASGKEAGNAMSLSDSMDPNNAVHRANEAKFERQATNEGRQGLADVGVLGALGAENASRTFGASGMPMTGGQMASIYGQNQNAAGTAMANTQRRMQSLRDQGIDRGYSESDKGYNRGQSAIDRANADVASYAGAGRTARTEQGNISGEEAGYGEKSQGLTTGNARDQANADMAVGGLEHELGNAGSQRELAETASDTGGRIADINGQIAGAGADKEAAAKKESGYVQAGAGVAGQIAGPAAKNFFSGGSSDGGGAAAGGGLSVLNGAQGAPVEAAAGTGGMVGGEEAAAAIGGLALDGSGQPIGGTNPYDNRYSGAPRRTA